MIAPGEDGTIPAALYLQGELERVQAVYHWRELDDEIRAAQGCPAYHLPTMAYEFHDVDVADACLYVKASQVQAGFGTPGWVTRGSVTHIEEAELISTPGGSYYFANHMIDDYPLELMIADHALPSLRLPTKPYHHDPGYRQIMNLPSSESLTHAYIEKLIVYRDSGQNSHKRERYIELRKRLRERVSGQGAKMVYLKRGSTGEARLVSNEHEVEERLVSLGFVVVEPEDLSTMDIVRLTLDSDLVVSVEGSHIANIAYSMSPKGTLLVLQPPDRFALHMKEMADAMGIRFAFIVGEADEGGFRVKHWLA
ncbi:MAG: glycosyltransferase family 61 protein, partial [Pseudomonadota bacterium]